MPAPITRDDLDSLITYHRHRLFSHRHHMNTASVSYCEQTIDALEHYRDLLDVIDNRQPQPDPLTPEPSLACPDTPTPAGDPR